MYGVSATPLSGAGDYRTDQYLYRRGDYASKLITEDGVQALTELANNIGDTDPIRLAGTEVMGTAEAVLNNQETTTDLGS